MNNMSSGITEGLFNLFRKPVATPSPTNTSPVDSPVGSPVGSPRGPVHSYGLGGAPLSPTVVDPDMELAEELVKKAQICSQYKKDVILALPEQLRDAREVYKVHAHTNEELIKMAGHPCVTVWIQGALADIENIGRETSVEAKEKKKSGVITGIAMLLASGFDKMVEQPGSKKPFFEREAGSGKIIGIHDTGSGQPNDRYKVCNAVLRVGDYLMGGKRKKTKKNKSKKRKTLRRRKLHR